MVGGQLREPVHALLHHRFQQIDFRREVPVDGARADPGTPGHLRQRHRWPLLGERALRGGQHRGAVAGGVAAGGGWGSQFVTAFRFRPGQPGQATRTVSKYGLSDPILSTDKASMSSSQRLILVTGATGRQGGATARKLLADGHAVRALVRDPHAPAARALAAAGAELAVGDFDDPTTLPAALAGATALFAVPPATYDPDGWDVEREARRGEALVDAARRAGVAQIVFTGIASFNEDTSWGASGKHRIETAVAASGARYTLLRPVRFMENYLLRGLPIDGIVDGVHRHMFPADRPMKVIAVADVAEIAALAFADPDRFHGQTLELAGDALTPSDAAAAIAAATGHPVRYQELDEAYAASLGESIAYTWRLMRETGGWRADIDTVRAIHPTLRTFDTWLTETGAAQIKSLLDSDRLPTA